MYYIVHGVRNIDQLVIKNRKFKIKSVVSKVSTFKKNYISLVSSIQLFFRVRGMQMASRTNFYKLTQISFKILLCTNLVKH